MAVARCTCIYRALPAPGPHQSPVTVITRDPFCPSADRHDREARMLTTSATDAEIAE